MEYIKLSEEIVDGYKVTKYKASDGTKITCRNPILDPEERERRMKLIIKAATDILLSVERKKGEVPA